MALIVNYQGPDLNLLALMNCSSLKGTVMWLELVLSTVYVCLGAENTIRPGGVLIHARMCQDMRKIPQEREGEAEKVQEERLSGGKSSMVRIIAPHRTHLLSGTNVSGGKV